MKIIQVTTADFDIQGHIESPFGIDMTLCGLTLDGDPSITKKIEVKEGKVTCEHCLHIVKFCKSLHI